VGVVLTVVILLTKRRPVSAVLWLVTVWAFPLLGALVYLSFGLDQVPRGARERAEASRILAESLPDVEDAREAGNGAETPTTPRLVPVPVDPARGVYPPTSGNRVDLLVDGDEFYPALFDAVASASDSVHVQSFIVAPDGVGRRLLDLLAERARAGVCTRLLYDRFGSTAAHYSGFFRDAERAGVGVSSITQAHPLRGRFQVNLRNHRKVAVVDGAVGFVGGINFSEANRSEPDHPRTIRDYHVRLTGPAVRGLQTQFLLDWFFATREGPETLTARSLLPDLPVCGDAAVQVVSGGPAPESSTTADVIFGLISEARQSVTIVTPYFVPDEATLQVIRHAAMAGRDVRLLVPEHGNHFYAELAGRSLYQELLDAGVQIFERAPPFMHAKALLIDERIVMLGSANMDYRSLHLNFETAVVAEGPAVAGELAAQIRRDLDAARELTPERHAARGYAARLMENFCYLFQPLL